MGGAEREKGGDAHAPGALWVTRIIRPGAERPSYAQEDQHPHPELDLRGSRWYGCHGASETHLVDIPLPQATR